MPFPSTTAGARLKGSKASLTSTTGEATRMSTLLPKKWEFLWFHAQVYVAIIRVMSALHF